MRKATGPVYSRVADLALWRKAGAQQRQPLSVVAGSFRILHPGNLSCLRLAAEKFGRVCVVLDPETSRPALDGLSSEARGSLLAQINGIGAIAVLPESEIISGLKILRPFILTDCPGEPFKSIAQKSARNLAEKVYDIEPLKGYFTENIIQAIRTGQTPLDCPGRPAGLQKPPDRDIAALLAGLAGKKIVTVNGCFDILHPGHLRLLSAARRMGDALIVLINDDESVRRYKGAPRPVFPVAGRLAALQALRPVTAAFSFPGDNPLPLLARIRPAAHVKGGSFSAERVRDEKKLLESWGGRIEFVEMLGNYSTSKIIAELNNSARKP